MRGSALILISSLALTAPAFAQSQNDGGIGGVLRGLGDQLQGGGQQQQQPSRDRDYRDDDRGASRTSSNRPTFRSDDDMRREQDRLDHLQGQINDAQRRLDRQWDDYNAARRDYERGGGRR